MELHEARDLLRKSQQDRKEARESLKTAQATVESSQLIIRGVLTRFPELAEEEREFEELWELDESPEKPRGAEAVLSVLQVAEGRWISVLEMVEMLEHEGWLPESGNPPNAVRAALERLFGAGDNHVEKGRRKNGGPVVYRYYHAEEKTMPVAEPQGYGYSEEPF